MATLAVQKAAASAPPSFVNEAQNAAQAIDILSGHDLTIEDAAALFALLDDQLSGGGDSDKRMPLGDLPKDDRDMARQLTHRISECLAISSSTDPGFPSSMEVSDQRFLHRHGM